MMILTVFVTKKERWLAYISAPLPPLGLPDLVNQITEHPCNIWDKHSQKKTFIVYPKFRLILSDHPLHHASSHWALWAEFKNGTAFAGSLSSACILPAPPPQLPSLSLSCRKEILFSVLALLVHMFLRTVQTPKRTLYTHVDTFTDPCDLFHLETLLNAQLLGLACVLLKPCHLTVSQKIIRKLNVNIKKHLYP